MTGSPVQGPSPAATENFGNKGPQKCHNGSHIQYTLGRFYTPLTIWDFVIFPSHPPTMIWWDTQYLSFPTSPMYILNSEMTGPKRHERWMWWHRFSAQLAGAASKSHLRHSDICGVFHGRRQIDGYTEQALVVLLWCLLFSAWWHVNKAVWVPGYCYRLSMSPAISFAEQESLHSSLPQCLAMDSREISSS